MNKTFLSTLLLPVFLLGCNPEPSGSSNAGDINDDSDDAGTIVIDDTPVNTAMTAQGKAADGYLVGATVCLDLNDNGACDLGEPTAVTVGGGEYSLLTTEEDIAEHSILVLVTETTIDEDTDAPVEKPYVLTAPAGQIAFISPISTLVQGRLDNNPNLTLAQAESAIVAVLGIIEDDLYSDFIIDSDLDHFHIVAQIVANAFGDATAALESSLGSEIAATAKKEIAMIMSDIVNNNLNQIVDAVAETVGSVDVNAITDTLVADAIVNIASNAEEAIENKTLIIEAVSLTPKSYLNAGIMGDVQGGFWMEGSDRTDVFSIYSRLETWDENADEITHYFQKYWDLATGGLIPVQDNTRNNSELSTFDTDTYGNWRVDTSSDGLEWHEFDYNSQEVIGEWLDDSTLQITHVTYLDGVVVDSRIQIIPFAVSASSLAGKNIQDTVTDWMNLYPMDSEYDRIAFVDIDLEIFAHSDIDAVFSEDTAEYFLTIYEHEVIIPEFDSYGSFISSVDGTDVDPSIFVDIQAVINSGVLIPAWALEYGVYYIKLNAAMNATGGTATLHRNSIDAPSNLSFIWTLTTVNGKPAISFDTTELSAFIETVAVIEADANTFIPKGMASPDRQDTIVFSDASTIAEITAVLDQAAAEYYTATLP